MSVSSPVPPVPVASAVLLRDRLLAVADLLGVHPSGAVMLRLLRTPPAILRSIARGRPVDDRGLPGEHLALLAVLAAVVRSRLADPDDEIAAVRLSAWRTWLATPSLAGPAGLERPIDRLADAGAVADAIAELVGGAGEPVIAGGAAGRATVRVVSVQRPLGPVEVAG